jgi:hypothetical protein
MACVTTGSATLVQALSVCAAVLCLQASPVHAQAPLRIEVHPVQTVTLTDEQFLMGSKQSPPVVIAGELRIPRPGTDRLPAVVLLHGAGGISANIDLWAQELNAIGVATFALDSYTGRGIVSVSENRPSSVAPEWRCCALELLRSSTLDPRGSRDGFLARRSGGLSRSPGFSACTGRRCDCV